MLNIDLLPKKLNEINYFKKEEKGSTLYSFSKKSKTMVICRLEEFEIEKDFCIEDKTLNMVKILSPIRGLVINDTFTIKSKKGNYKAKLVGENLLQPNLVVENFLNADVERLSIASKFVDNNSGANGGKVVLTGVNVNSLGDIQATDSYFAFRYLSGKTREENEEVKDIIIPKDFIDFITKEFSGNITINFNKNTCFISKDNITYVSRYIDGKYPNMDMIFKNKGFVEISYNLNEFEEKFNIAKQVGLSENKIATNIVLTGSKLIANGLNTYETELNNESQNFDFDICLGIDKVSAVFDNLSKKEKNLTLITTGKERPVFINDNDNEFVILPMRRL